jgi:hypothetical protein
MRPVDQTRFGSPDGNCFAACVASLLEIPLEEAPDLMKLPDWYVAFEEWLRPRGLYPVGFSCDGEPPGWALAGLHILSGGSPRGDFLHSVVARGREIVHDPHPSRDGLRSLKDRIVLVPLDPAWPSVVRPDLDDAACALAGAAASLRNEPPDARGLLADAMPRVFGRDRDVLERPQPEAHVAALLRVGGWVVLRLAGWRLGAGSGGWFKDDRPAALQVDRVDVRGEDVSSAKSS